ncbi:hypothetical protein [Leptospira alexanderi]|uniref:hypothetical protein n=1 Tax=Leptospira alexanderi TaxID=100053 RepID=UPI000991282A|nr:hypothetical protein [Leptospira alexanderi]
MVSAKFIEETKNGKLRKQIVSNSSPEFSEENALNKAVQEMDTEKDLSELVSSKEFDKFISFSNEEISIEDVEPLYCPNTIE